MFYSIVANVDCSIYWSRKDASEKNFFFSFLLNEKSIYACICSIRVLSYTCLLDSVMFIVFLNQWALMKFSLMNVFPSASFSIVYVSVNFYF